MHPAAPAPEVIESRQAGRRPLLRRLRPLFLVAGVFLVFGTATLARLSFARLAEHPGHGDESFYYTVARNLATGRGFVIDYVWHYSPPPAGVTHPSNDYWLPLTSLVISLSLRAFGHSLFAALLPAILAGVLLAALTYRWSRILSDSPLAALGAATLVLFEPVLFTFSLTTATPIYYALLASLTLLFLTASDRRSLLFPISAVCAGLASLIRHDGFLLLLTLIVALATAPLSRRAKWRYGLLSVCLYGAVLAPWLVHNYLTLGSPVPQAAAKLAFIRDYEDRYTFARELSLGSYLSWGAGNILRAKLDNGLWNLRTLWSFLGGLLWLPALIGLAEVWLSPARRPQRRFYLPGAVLLASMLVFHTLVTAATLLNSAVSIIPFLLVAAVDVMRRHLRSAGLTVVALAVVGASFYTSAFEQAGGMTAQGREMARGLQQAKAALDAEARRAAHPNLVVMTRIPWEVHHSTGYRTIQIPSDDLETIFVVARRYGATHLLLHTRRRPALLPIYAGRAGDDRVELVSTIPFVDHYLDPGGGPLKLFRLRLPAR